MPPQIVQQGFKMANGFDYLAEVVGYFWHFNLIWVLPLMALMVWTLIKSRRIDGRSLYINLGIFIFALLALIASGIIHQLGQEYPARIIRNIGLLFEGIAVIRLAGPFVFRVLLPLVRFKPASILEDISVIFGYLVLGMVHLSYAGLELSSILTTSVVLTAVLAFAMQDTLGNILGGLSLQLDNSIQKGDWIAINDIKGKVIDIHWRSTTVETRDWESIVIPNSILMKNSFRVLGKWGGERVQLRRWIWFNVSYLLAPARVIALVEKELNTATIANVARSPEPHCVLMEFDEETGSARYAARYWLTDLTKDDPTDSEVRLHIYAALQREGITPAISQKAIKMVEKDAVLYPGFNQMNLPEAIDSLDKIDIFSSLSEEQKQAIASQMTLQTYAKGSLITKQGEKAKSMYILAHGSVDIVFETKRQSHLLAVMEANSEQSYFGEMGLLTGEPRSANVLAKTDVECFELVKEDFEKILQARPQAAEEIALRVAERQLKLEEIRNKIKVKHDSDEKNKRQFEVARKIRNFFSL